MDFVAFWNGYSPTSNKSDMLTGGLRSVVRVAALVTAGSWGIVALVLGANAIGLGPWMTELWAVLMLGLFAGVGWLAVAALSLCALPFPGYRRTAMVILPVGIGMFVLSFAALAAVDRVVMYSLERLASRAAPLVQALHEYSDTHGTPPRVIDELVPEYLSRVPRGVSVLRLITGQESQSVFGGNPWALSLTVRVSPVDSDVLLYVPAENYESFATPEYFVRRIGRWAYLSD